MTGKQFGTILEKLGLESWAAAARFLGTNERTVRRWANDEWDIPNAVAMLLRLMDKHKVDAKQAFKLGIGEQFRG
jgi:DNA-binding transcriptional regulator YiaG